jgi:uncharacterized OsmC-like protein
MTMPMMKKPDIVTNGVNVTQLAATLDAIKQTPSLAAFQFRAKNQWLGGGLNRSTIQDFYGAGQEDTSRGKPFTLEADEPPVLLGGDRGANPVEFVLHALAACMTTTMAYHAAARGIEIGAIESELEGDLDLRGFLGLSDTVRKGYHDVRVKFRVESDAAPEDLAELAKFSPVYDIVSNSLPVDVRVEIH